MKIIKQSVNHNYCCRGFTLIEMVITIMIIIVLSSISIPIYRNYVSSAKLAEGYVLLAAIRDAQKRYYNEWGNFLYCNSGSAQGHYSTTNDEVLGIDARGNKYFTIFCIAGYEGRSLTKYYFECYVVKPPEFRSNNNTALMLQYNISLGEKIVDRPRGVDSSWY